MARRCVAVVCAALAFPLVLIGGADAGPAPAALKPTSVTVSGNSGYALDAPHTLTDRAPMTKWSGPTVPATTAAPQWAQLSYAGPVTIEVVGVHGAQAYQSQPNNIADINRTNGYELLDVEVTAWLGATQVGAEQVTGNTADHIGFRFVPAVTADRIRVSVTRATLNGAPANAMLGEITAYPPGLAGPEQAKMADSIVDMVGVATHWYAGDGTPSHDDPAWGHFDTPFANGEPSLFDRLVQGGFRHFRDELPGNPGIAQRTAAKIAKLGNAGVRGTISMDNQLGVYPYDGNCPCPGYSTATQVLDMVAANADPSKPFPVEMVEGPNETDARSWRYEGVAFPQATRTYNDRLYDSLRAHSDPRISTLPLLTPAMAQPQSHDTLGNLWPRCDALNFHMYPGGGGDDMPDYSVDYGFGNGQGALSYGYNACKNPGTGVSAPVYPTETGYIHQNESSTGRPTPWLGVTERAAAKYSSRLVMDYYRMGLKRASFYDLIDGAQSYGLIANDGRAYPSYHALKNMNTLLADPGPAFTPGALDYTLTGGSPFTLRHQLLQKRNGTFYLALWLNAVSTNTDATGIRTDRDTSQEVTLTLNQPITKAAVYLPSESAAPTATFVNPTTLTLHVPDQVMLVRLGDGDQTAPPAPAPFEPPAPTCTATADSSDQLNASLFKPSNAFDGRRDTSWQSAEVPGEHWVQCEFNYDRTVNEVTVTGPDRPQTGGQPYRLTDFDVVTRKSDGSFEVQKSVTGNTAEQVHVTFDPVVTDAVRIVVKRYTLSGAPYVSAIVSEVTISPAPLLLSLPTVSPEPSAADAPATASAAVSGGLAPLTCTVTYGDGSPPATGTIADGMCTGPAHTYATPGDYLVQVRLRDAGGAELVAATAHTVTPASTALTLSAPASAPATDSATLSAVLTRGGVALAGRTVRFTLGPLSEDAVTDAAGVALLNLTLNLDPGSYVAGAAFAGDATVAPSTASAPVTVTPDTTTLRYTGPTQARGELVSVSAVLTEDAGVPMAGRLVNFTMQGRTVPATTDATGRAATTLAVLNHGSSQQVSVSYAGETRYAPSTVTALITWGSKPQQ